MVSVSPTKARMDVRARGVAVYACGILDSVQWRSYMAPPPVRVESSAASSWVRQGSDRTFQLLS